MTKAADDAMAELHQKLADMMEGTEQAMHAAADAMRNPARTNTHERAQRVSDRARREEANAARRRGRR